MRSMKRCLSVLMTLALTLSFLPAFPLVTKAEGSYKALPQAAFQGSFVVELWEDGAYHSIAVIEADKYQRDYAVELGDVMNPKLRISKQADGMALLDAVLLDGAPPAVADGDEVYVLRKLSAVNLDMLEISAEGIELGFAGAGQTLVLTGRIEPDPPGGLSFLFDVKTDVDRNVTALLASYSMDNYGTLDIDGVAGLDPADAFRVYPTRPTSGHPDSRAWVWVMHDDEYLYAAAEWGSDNTYDYGLDFFRIFIDSGDGIKAYTQWSDRGEYGIWAYAYTDLLPYQHMCYEIAIPLAELGNPDNVKLGFSLYGTAYTDRWIDWSGSSPSTPNYADAYTPGAWNDDVKELTIYTAAELGRFASEVNSYENSYPELVGYNYEGWTIYLGDDIDLSAYKWYPVNMTNVVFDGQGHTISGMVVEEIVEYMTQWGFNAEAAGLFGVLDRAVVKNLTLENPEITMPSWQYFPCAGAVAGYAEGAQIRDVVIINPQIQTGWFAHQGFLGGVLGYAIESAYPNSIGLYMNIINGVEVYGGSIIDDCSDTDSDAYIGGIVGANNNGAVGNTTVYGTEIITSATGISACIGGIAGYTSAESFIEFETCLLNNISMAVFDIADDSGSDFYVGGICGFVNGDHVVNNLYIGDLDLFGELEAGIYTVCNNEKYEDVAAANTACFTDIFNDATPNTGGFWLAASITDDDTGFGFVESMKRLKTWTVKTIFDVSDTPAFGAYWEPKTPVTNVDGSATVTYVGDTFDLSAITGLFTVDSNAGARTYTVETVSTDTGAGSIGADEKTLTVTAAGTFTIGLATAATATHEAGTLVTAMLTVTKGAQAAPTGLGQSDVTTKGGSDGEITGVTTAMEYILSGDASYTTVVGTTVIGLEAGTYLVRYAETDLYEASGDTVVTVSEPSRSSGGDTGEDDITTPPSSQTPATPSATGPTGSTATGAGTTPAAGGPVVYVDGKQTNAGTVTQTEGKTVVTVNQDIINHEIEAAADNVTVVVPTAPASGAGAGAGPAAGVGDGAEAQAAEAHFVVKNVDDMAEKDMTLSVQAGDVRYDIPTAAIDTAAIMAALGADDPAQVPLSVTITTSLGATALEAVKATIDTNGSELVFPPVAFTITATYNGQVTEVTTFAQYVSRTMEITAEQAAKVTTAVVVEPDGSIRHVPTYVYQEGGKWYVTVNCLTNSVYALIYNDVVFSDAAGKWYEAAVNEMGSREVVSGVGDGIFEGERAISRAEFTAILVRAMGLPAGRGAQVFDDVPASAWYSGAVNKAYEYGLTVGVGGGKFAPESEITRQEAMAMVYRAAKLMGYTSGNATTAAAVADAATAQAAAGGQGEPGGPLSLEAFPDAGAVSAWAIGAAEFNVGAGLIAGSDGMLLPAEPISRAETAVLILRLLRGAGLVDDRASQ